MKKTLLLPLLLISLSRLLNAQCVGALDLPTTTDYVQFTNPFYSYTNEITVEGWVYMDGSINSTPWIGQATSGVDNMGSNVWHWHGAGPNELSWQVNDNGTWRGIGSTAMTNGWHHVATVADNVSIRIYIDGILNVTGPAITGAIVTNSNSEIHVGHDVRFPAGAGGRNGDYKIGEFRVWNVARTPSEISTNMSSCLTGTETGLKLYNKFENGIGSSATSAVGPNGTLVNMNTTTSWVTGSGSECCTPAAALNFDGADDYVEIGNVIPSGSSYTKEMWVYAADNGCNNLLSSGDDPFYLSSGRLAAGNNGNYNYVQDGTNFPLNTWTHAAVTYDALTSTMVLYVNGIMVASGNSAGPYSGLPTTYIGRHTGACYFSGKLDEVRVWNVARTQCEINTYMNCEIPSMSTGLLANYHFNQGFAGANNSAETNLVDASGNSNTGTLNNFSLTGTSSNWIAPGAVVSDFSTPTVCPAASALNFDGANDIVSIPSSIGANNLGLSAFTLESWVYPNSASGAHSIIRKSGDYNLYLNNGNLCAEVWPLGTSDPTWKFFTGVGGPALNQWSHVSFTWNGTTGTLYVNGSEISSTIVNGSVPVSENLCLGASSVFGNHLNGSLDEVRIWNTTLTQCEINTYMNCEISNSMIGLLANYHFNQGLSGYSNPTETTLTDASGNANTGTLNNFALTGTFSNWVSPGGVVSGYTTTLAPPVITVNSGAICSGSSFTMIPTGATTYTYSSGTDIVSPTSDVTYSVSGTASTGCISLVDAVSSVTVNALPMISVNSGAICSGNSFTMVPSGAATYTYSNGSDIVTPSSDATYSVSGTDANGCVSSTDAISSVTVNALPTITVNSGTICSGNSFTMVPTGAATYTYSNGSDIATPIADATYSVSGTDANGCVSLTDAVSSVTVNALPTISVNSGAICSGSSFTMTPTGATTYTYSNGSDIATPTADATYSVSGTDANGCVSDVDAISSVTVNALPTISVNSGSICAGQSFTMVPTGADSYVYSSGSDVVNPTTDATYTVTGTNTLTTCAATIESSVTVNALPTLTATTSNTLLCTGETATISVMGSATSFTWNTTENTTDIAVTPTTATTYTVDGTDANGCINTTTILQDVNTCTGVVSLNGNTTFINVYPNPNNGLFVIDLNTSSQVSITNALGQIVFTETLNSGKQNLDIQNQADGIYFVKVTQQDKQHIIKLIKK